MINIDKHVRPIKKTAYKTYDKQALDDLIRQTAVFDMLRYSGKAPKEPRWEISDVSGVFTAV
jgi:hypothetical protein